MRDEIRKVQELMEAADYVTDAPIATSVHLAMCLRKPLLVEGPAGVGKTEVAKVMARMLGTNLIRLQCYEGLDASTALYEWNYQKQLLHIKLEEGGHNSRPMDEKEHEIFSEPFLRSEEHTSELQSQSNLVCRLLLEKKKTQRKRRASDDIESRRRSA